MSKLIKFLKNETVFCVAGVLAIATAFVVHPSKAYIDYIDFRVLAILFCLMLVVAALRKFGIFEKLTEQITAKVRSVRMLSLILVFSCFLFSMVITNDVALITFVPFAIEILTAAGKKKYIMYVVILQTIAANLGSMVTPIGNPQNIFLFTKYKMTFELFFRTLWPYVLAAIILLLLSLLFIKNEEIDKVEKDSSDTQKGGYKLIIVAITFATCIACVSRVLDYRIMLGATIVFTILIDYKLFKKADYILILTFVAFFIMTGNIRAMKEFSEKISEFMQGREVYASIISSQVISNVPAAVLLSNFTDKGVLLLIGCNIGGLGTLIASMANLISFRYYGETEGAKKGKYLALFTGINIIFLAVMLGIKEFL